MNEQLLELLELLENELKGDEFYLKGVQRFYSLYQEERFKRMYGLLAEARRIVELQQLGRKHFEMGLRRQEGQQGG